MSGCCCFPLTIRSVELHNRIVVPPMHQYSAVKGSPPWHLMNAGKLRLAVPASSSLINQGRAARLRAWPISEFGTTHSLSR
jgi:hypothetical protein